MVTASAAWITLRSPDSRPADVIRIAEMREKWPCHAPVGTATLPRQMDDNYPQKTGGRRKKMVMDYLVSRSANFLQNSAARYGLASDGKCILLINNLGCAERQDVIPWLKVLHYCRNWELK